MFAGYSSKNVDTPSIKGHTTLQSEIFDILFKTIYTLTSRFYSEFDFDLSPNPEILERFELLNKKYNAQHVKNAWEITTPLLLENS